MTSQRAPGLPGLPGGRAPAWPHCSGGGGAVAAARAATSARRLIACSRTSHCAATVAMAWAAALSRSGRTALPGPLVRHFVRENVDPLADGPLVEARVPEEQPLLATAPLATALTASLRDAVGRDAVHPQAAAGRPRP